MVPAVTAKADGTRFSSAPTPAAAVQDSPSEEKSNFSFKSSNVTTSANERAEADVEAGNDADGIGTSESSASESSASESSASDADDGDTAM